MVMKEAFMGARAVASLTKLKMSQLGKRDNASLTGLALILACDTDNVRYNIYQLKSDILDRYHIS